MEELYGGFKTPKSNAKSMDIGIGYGTQEPGCQDTSSRATFQGHVEIEMGNDRVHVERMEYTSDDVGEMQTVC